MRPIPLNIQSLCQRYKVSTRGVIHVGAHEGQELNQYLEMGAEQVILIEANPQIFTKLQESVKKFSNVIPLNYAVCDRSGEIKLRLNAYDYSISILPLKHHRDIYPNMLEVGEVSVEGITLDGLLLEQNLDSNKFNILALDIQGAELLALSGSTATLKTVDAIYTEVNLQELYEGCALIGQIDEFLEGFNFQRVALRTPFHPTYGDAFYVKRDILAKSQTTILTSIAPHNHDNQKLAISSWRSHGLNVISLNNKAEVRELESIYPEVTFYAVNRDAGAEVGRPLIYFDDIWAYIQNQESTGNGIFGIINSDIHLKADFDCLQVIEREAQDGLVVCSRVEIENSAQTAGQIYTRGFDAFFFHENLSQKLPKSDFCLGMPWWDFWLPLIAQRQGVPLKYLTTAIAYHIQHPINYRNDLWEKFGIKFTQLFKPELVPIFQKLQDQNSSELRPKLIGIIDAFLQSFHAHAHRISQSMPITTLKTENINHEAAELHLETGDIYREQGKLAEAIASYQKALTQDPNFAAIFLGMAKIYLSQGMLEPAIEAITNIQALEPELLNGELYIQLGKISALKGKFEDAVQYLQQGIDLVGADQNSDDLRLDGYLNLAEIFSNQGNWDRAVHIYQQAIALSPKSVKAHWQLAQVLQLQSLAHQQEALDLEPTLMDVSQHFDLGINFSNQGRLDWAIRAYQRAIRLKPDWAEAHCNLGNALSSVGRLEEAAKSLKKAIALNPDLIEAFSNLGNVLVSNGDIDGGISYHQKAIQLKPDWAELHFNLADALLKQNRIEETFTALQTAIRLKPNLAEAQRLIGNVLMIQGNFSEAVPHLQIATQLKPDWSDAHHNLGKALAANGQLQEAIAEYQQAIALTPAWALAYWDLGIAHWLMEQTPETIACFQKTVELQPNLADVHQGLCTLLRIGGNFPACRQAVERYAQTCQDIDAIRVLVTLVKCYLESGLYDIAQNHFQQLESKLLQPNVTLQDSEVRLIYEDLVFSLPYLRDRIDLNGHLNKLMGGAYTQLCLPIVSEKEKPKSTKKKAKSAEPLRIGIISKHLRRHSVGWCSRGIIKEWSKLTPHLYLYVTGRGGSDDLTAEFKEMTANFFDFSQKSNTELLEKLQSDRLDVLIDMDSVMNPSHALILHNSPAQIVCSWLGCEAPYISEKNYYLSDRHTHPESVQPYYREQLIRMPDFAVAIADFPSKSIDREALRQNLGITSDMVVYLSVATGHKVNPDSVRSHISILQQVPQSILLHKGFCDVEIVRSLYQQECQKAGIDAERCRFITRQPMEEDHRSFYQIADIALDTYPYNGGTHNLESLWFDLPIVTLCGEQAPSRMGYSFLKAVGISEGVAKTWEEYIDWAVKIGSDRHLKMDLQARIKQSKQPETLSPIWNPQKFAKDALALFQSLLKAT